MRFISLSFLLLLAVSAAVYYAIPKRLQWVWLLAVSFFFYLTASPKYLLFLCFSIVTTFFACRWIGAFNAGGQAPAGRAKKKAVAAALVNRKKKAVLLGALLLNIGVLFVLKYAGFALSLLQNLAPGREAPVLGLLLPLGISFYTLQVVGYCIDVYRGKYAPEQNLAKYALFVSFFPQIVQGPIARFDQLAHQFSEPHPFDFARVRSGVQLLLWGFFKKLVVADRAGLLVDTVFLNYQNYGGFQIYVASVFYTMQLYADFSGCVDIARGAAQMFGIELAQNFDHPYFALSIQDFWRRWHMSLSSWFRDYLYIPLGGNRKGTARKYLNVLAVFLVSGLWHGAGLSFIVWGLLHGLYQVVGALIMPVRDRLARAFQTDRGCFSHKLFQGFVTFQLVNFAWIFFRAGSLTKALNMIRYMFTVYNPWIFTDGSLYNLGLNLKEFHLAVFGFLLILIVSILQRRTHVRRALAKQNPSFQFILTCAAVFAIVFFGVYGSGYNAANFIYENF